MLFDLGLDLDFDLELQVPEVSGSDFRHCTRDHIESHKPFLNQFEIMEFVSYTQFDNFTITTIVSVLDDRKCFDKFSRSLVTVGEKFVRQKYWLFSAPVFINLKLRYCSCIFVQALETVENKKKFRLSRVKF